MKRLLLRSLSGIMIMTMGSGIAFAEMIDYTDSKGVIYELDTTAKTASMKESPLSEITEYSIPNSILYQGETYPVVALLPRCGARFANSLQTLKIGDNVTEIGEKAFYACQNITSLTLGSKVKIIGTQAFYNCVNIGNVTLPEGVEEIRDFAFWNNNVRTNVTIPASVKTIGSNPWGANMKLTAFNVAAGNENFKVVDGVLYDKDVTLLISYPVGNTRTTFSTPSTLKVIGANSMRNNYYMTKLTLNEGLTELQSGSLNVCRFTEITIPSTVSRMGTRVLTSNPNLTKITVAPGNNNFAVFDDFLCTKDGKMLLTGINKTNVVIPASVDSICDGAFYQLRAIQTLNLNNTRSVGPSAFYSTYITTIDFGKKLERVCDKAFMNCSYLTEITFPATMRRIEDRQAFLQCTRLEKINFNEGIEYIGAAAFMNNPALKSVIVPGSVKGFGEAVFYFCQALESIEVKEGCETISYMFAPYNPNLKSVKLPNTVKLIDRFAFGSNNALTDVNLPEGLEEVRLAAFQEAPLSGKLILPKNMKRVGENSFGYCRFDTVITNEGLKYIGKGAFGSNHEKLRCVEVKEGVDSICSYAFGFNRYMVDVSLPSTVTYLGDSLLINCVFFSHLYVAAAVPPKLAGDPLPEERYEMASLYVPKESIDAYRAAPYWSKFHHIFALKTSSIEDIDSEGAKISEIYDINGIRRSEVRQGLNIIKYEDGSVKKVYVK